MFHDEPAHRNNAMRQHVGRTLMRFIISAIAAVLAASSITATPSVAQTAQGSLTQAYNSCIELAMQRGWTESDISNNRRELRNFIARCIQGREARAQKQPRR
jgi:hypothetical protein